ncbi:hypothetical protein GLE_3258 [Lysobacter enzymogenes]|uniref:Uncharacterized protein n=1 Tax=Lysobacter enzymogenes TaxID=69 RepID=A0A0S2DJ92_LYSEN|nr:hypothetical protein GLE_3258 [Lysobacter enzymogenes]
MGQGLEHGWGRGCGDGAGSIAGPEVSGEEREVSESAPARSSLLSARSCPYAKLPR